MLPIQITGQNIDITETLNSYINNKFTKITRHADKITNIHIILNVTKLIQKVEVKMHVPGNEIFASAESEDMYKTIDIVIDKLVRQLDKYREKNSENHYRDEQD